MESQYILEMNGISKSFPGVKALDNVSIRLRRSSVHAILGENGAGKSTLMKILSGIYSADAGTIIINGKEAKINSVQESRNFGIGMIHQELSNANNMSITENIFLNEEIVGNCGFIDKKKMHNDTQQMLDENGLNISPDTLMGQLSVAQMQVIEIMKAVSKNAKVIVMDEPTSALTRQEIRKLFCKIKELKANGVSIFYISHKLEEISEICDEVTILRDGKSIDTRFVKDINEATMISLMVGRSMTNVFPPKEERKIGNVVFELENFTGEKGFKNISLKLRAGEIVGLSGLMGAGRSELARAIVGLDSHTGGRIILHNKELHIRNVRDSLEQRIVLVPEDRKLTGFVPARSILENITLPHLKRFTKCGFVNKQAQDDAAMKYYEALKIKASSPQTNVVSLSGGNQQKVVVAKWLMAEPEVIILDEPTRGIDVGAKYEIYILINTIAAQGKAVLMISSELPEILGMSDRILVMHEGELRCEMCQAEATQEKIMYYATGGK